jgi:hypothetical protein
MHVVLVEPNWKQIFGSVALEVMKEYGIAWRW